MREKPEKILQALVFVRTSSRSLRYFTSESAGQQGATHVTRAVDAVLSLLVSKRGPTIDKECVEGVGDSFYSFDLSQSSQCFAGVCECREGSSSESRSRSSESRRREAWEEV